mmetsp:Transcript_2044/g.5658  ORF Transcript_2044/g.5658 Transcript_2044/m.5658 type:complete len:343 (-) Transcript_2044:275-1303(-)
MDLPDTDAIFSMLFGDAPTETQYSRHQHTLISHSRRKQSPSMLAAPSPSLMTPTPPPPPPADKKRTKRRSRKYRRPIFKDPAPKSKPTVQAKEAESSASRMQHSGVDARMQRMMPQAAQQSHVQQSIPIMDDFRHELQKISSQEQEDDSTLVGTDEQYRAAVRARSLIEINTKDQFDKRSIKNRIPPSLKDDESPKEAAVANNGITFISNDDCVRRVSEETKHGETDYNHDDGEYSAADSFQFQPIKVKRNISDLSQFLFDVGAKMGINRPRRSEIDSDRGHQGAGEEEEYDDSPILQTRNDGSVNRDTPNASFSAMEYSDINYIIDEHRELPDVLHSQSFY